MITTIVTDGLGNQMFQYALGKHLSIKHKTGLRIETQLRQKDGLLDKLVIGLKNAVRNRSAMPSRRYYSIDIFNIPTQPSTHPVTRLAGLTLYIKYVSRLGRTIIKEKHFHYDKDVVAHTPDNSLLIGYWQSPLYFQDINPILRKEFTFKNPILPISKNILQTMQATSSVCMHVRRGDYLKFHLHNTISDSSHYFHQAAAHMADKLNTTPHFFVFSDDILWCKENIQLDYPTTFVDETHAGEKDGNHLQLMKNCKHFIISNSSFSWWAVWLCDNPQKIVIAPEKWFNSPTKDTSDLVPRDWIRL